MSRVTPLKYKHSYRTLCLRSRMGIEDRKPAALHPAVFHMHDSSPIPRSLVPGRRESIASHEQDLSSGLV
jgi:hypothetical protein